jgi:hypothetical protein
MNLAQFYEAIRAYLASGEKIPARVGWTGGTGYCEAQVFPDDIKRALEGHA